MRRPVINTHIDAIAEAIDTPSNIDALREAARRIIYTDKLQGTVWVVGNGGSLAIAQHFAQDLLKTCGIRAQALNDGSVLTAYSNDIAFSQCHEAPLKVLWREKQDVLFIFSCSGKSRNVQGLTAAFFPVVAVVGTDGGFLKKSAACSIHALSKDYDICETGFSVIADLIVREVKKTKDKKGTTKK